MELLHFFLLVSLSEASGLFFEHRRRTIIVITEMLSPKVGQFLSYHSVYTNQTLTLPCIDHDDKLPLLAIAACSLFGSHHFLLYRRRQHSSSCHCWRIWRRVARARCRRLLTVMTVTPSMTATSAADRPSRSRKRKTCLCDGSKTAIALAKSWRSMIWRSGFSTDGRSASSASMEFVGNVNLSNLKH